MYKKLNLILLCVFSTGMHAAQENSQYHQIHEVSIVGQHNDQEGIELLPMCNCNGDQHEPSSEQQQKSERLAHYIKNSFAGVSQKNIEKVLKHKGASENLVRHATNGSLLDDAVRVSLLQKVELVQEASRQDLAPIESKNKRKRKCAWITLPFVALACAGAESLTWYFTSSAYKGK